MNGAVLLTPRPVALVEALSYFPLHGWVVEKNGDRVKIETLIQDIERKARPAHMQARWMVCQRASGSLEIYDTKGNPKKAAFYSPARGVPPEHRRRGTARRLRSCGLVVPSRLETNGVG